MTISGSRPVRSESRRISSRWASVSCNRDGDFFAGGALDRFPNVLRGVFAIAAVYHGRARSAAAREEALPQLEVAEQDHADEQTEEEQQTDHVDHGLETL